MGNRLALIRHTQTLKQLWPVWGMCAKQTNSRRANQIRVEIGKRHQNICSRRGTYTDSINPLRMRIKKPGYMQKHLDWIKLKKI